MILPRKYEWLGILYEKDPESRKLIDEAFALPEFVSSMSKKELVNYNYASIPAYMDTDCMIPGECYAHFMKGFEKLDVSNPYDNGLTFKDVTKIEFETSRKGTAIQMKFVWEGHELPYRIIGITAVENYNGRIRMNKGWY